jgi:hypothetical protein
MLMVAPGMAACEESVTVPEIVPPVICANDEEPIVMHRTSAPIPRTLLSEEPAGLAEVEFAIRTMFRSDVVTVMGASASFAGLFEFLELDSFLLDDIGRKGKELALFCLRFLSLFAENEG